MNNILSAISGQFGKTLIFSTLLPVSVFVLLAWIFFVPLLPNDLLLLVTFRALDTEWKLAAISFAALLLAGLLLNLNIPIIRFYEGYPWKESWIGGLRLKRLRSEFDALSSRWQGMRTLLYATVPPAELERRRSEITERWRKIGSAVNREFPNSRDSVLPTRLGNVIRSFETYPDVQYRIDAVVLWPRLIGKIDKDYAAAVDETKAVFDFTLNSAVLNALLALAILLSGLLHPVPLVGPERLIPWLLGVAFFTLASHGFYLLSIGRAAAWGEMVKGAFDLYRWELLRQMGYKGTFATLQEERRFWDDLSRQMLYGDSPRVQPPAYSAEELLALGDPSHLDLKVVRGVTRAADPAKLIVTLRVVNADEQGRAARNVVLRDSIPEGFDYEWNSAEVADRAVVVTGSNPLAFLIGKLEFKHAAELTYRIIVRKKPA